MRRGALGLLGLLGLGFVAFAFAQPKKAPPPPDLVGDGAADETAALQALVDRGGVVRLPKGVFRLTKSVVVDMKAGYTAIEGGTVAQVVMAGPGPAFRFVGTHGATAAPPTVEKPVWEKQRMPALDGVEIVGEHEQADAVEASGTMQLTVSRVLVRGCRHGVRLTSRNRNLILSDCHIYSNRGVGVFFDGVNLHQANVTGCHISYNLGGGVVVRGGEVRNLQIAGCDIEANHAKGGPPTANVFVDSTDGSNAEVAITGNTLQHTHDAPASANIWVKGPSVKWPAADERRDGNVTITGNVISDAQVNVRLDHARGVVLTGNTLWTGYAHNLLVEGSSHVVVGANVLDRNPRYGKEETPATANAVVFRNCSDCTVTGLHVAGVRAAAAGVAFETCDRFHVTGCTVLDCEPVGVLLKDVTRSRVAGNLIRDDRPGAKTTPLKTEGGSGNTIVE